MFNPRFYYVNSRLNGKTALLAGPFFTSADAEAVIDIVGPMFTAECPPAQFATFGIVDFKAHAGFGRYNLILSQGGVAVPLPDDTRH